MLTSTDQRSGLNWNQVLFLVVVDDFKQEWLQLSWRTDQTSPATFPETERVFGGQWSQSCSVSHPESGAPSAGRHSR